jgi:hypothetical protein
MGELEIEISYVAKAQYLSYEKSVTNPEIWQISTTRIPN